MIVMCVKARKKYFWNAKTEDNQTDNGKTGSGADENPQEDDAEDSGDTGSWGAFY